MANDPEFTLKGHRDYLQSASVLDDLCMRHGPDTRDIDLTFERKTSNQVRYQVEPPARKEDLVATWRASTGTLYVVDRHEPIATSVQYDEPALVARLSLADGVVTIPEDVGPFTVFEAIIAAYKTLLHRTVTGPDVKLAFVRIRLPAVPVLPLEVRFVRSMGDFHQGELRASGRPAGQIFFGEWAQ